MRLHPDPGSARTSPTTCESSVQRSPAWSCVLLAAVLAVLAALTTACSSSKNGAAATTAHSAATAPAAVLSSTASTGASSQSVASRAVSTAAPAAGLSGTWSGQYSGSYHGTFTLTWTQSGSKLSGDITLSNPPGTLNITGTLHGSAIRFGAVGAFGINYSGSVSGSSMSGTYQVQAGTGSNSGPWSATKKR